MIVAAPAISNAAAEVAMTIIVSLRVMDMSLNQYKLGFPSLANVSRELQQLRADLQSGVVGRIQIDLESNLVVVDEKSDHASGGGKIIRLAHRQRRRVPEDTENPLRARLLRAAHKQHMATVLPLNLREALHRQCPVARQLPSNGVVQVVAERILAQYAEVDRALRGTERRRRPLDKLGKIHQKN